MKNKGFSLVELIVVIAIMAILVGVAVPVYTSYIGKAQKNADISLVDEITRAVEIANITDPMTGTAAIILKKDGATIVGGDAASAAWLEKVINSTFGSAADLKLKYGDWGNGAAVSQDTILYFASIAEDDALYGIYNGTAKPSFAENVDDLFVVIKDTASTVGDVLGQSGALLVQNAADFTLSKENNTTDFAEAWASQEWDTSILGSESGEYNENAGDLSGDDLSAAIANAAAIKARNTALAEYLAAQGFAEVYDVFAGYEYGSSGVPKDAVGAIMTSTGRELEAEIDEAYIAKYGEDGLGDYWDGLLASIDTYYGFDQGGSYDVTTTPAYTDGLAYYALMNTVGEVNADNSDDDTYWNEMAAAVSLYGDIATGKASLSDLKQVYNALGEIDGENAVVITFVVTDDGLTVDANPSGVKPE